MPPPSVLARVDRILDRTLYLLSGLLVLVIAGTVVYAVAARYFFNAPPLWAEDAPRVFFVWATYLGFVVATRRNQNLRVTHFIDMFAPLPRLVLELVMHVLVLIMIVVIVYWSIPILQLQLRGTMLSTGWSYAWTYAALPVGLTLTFVYQVRQMVQSVADYRRRLAGDEQVL